MKTDKRMKKNCIIFVILTFCGLGCSPKITSNLSSMYEPLVEEEEVVVLDASTPVPADAESLGTVKIGDTGFTTSENGSYDAVITIAKEKARLAGGNVVRIISHKSPDMLSTIHRIEVEILRISDISSLDLSRVSIINAEHGDCAIIYFYRKPGMGVLVNYDVHIGETTVYRARINSTAEVKVYEAGQLEIWAKTESKTSLPITVELGGEYYIRCDVDKGAFVGRPAFEIVPFSIGKSDYDSIKD